MEFAIVEHCATKVNSLKIPPVEIPLAMPTCLSYQSKRNQGKVFFVLGWGQICAFKLTRTQHVSNFIFTTCVAHKKLIQSAQYNLYPIWTTNKQKDTRSTSRKGRNETPGDLGPETRTNDAQSHTAISPKRRANSFFFCNFYDPKRRINSEGQISEQRTPNTHPIREGSQSKLI